MKRFHKFVCAIFGGFGSLAAALVVPILMQKASSVMPALAKVSDNLIQATYAQTAPATMAEMTTSVTNMATSIIPGWVMYAVFALVVALAIWLIGRAISGMKRA